MKDQFDYEKKITGQKEYPLSDYVNRNYLKEEIGQVKGKVLDVGCGAGLRVGRLKEAYPDLSLDGVDISRKAIEIAKRDWPGVSFQVASADDLPFGDNYFQAVIMRNVLEHLDNPEKALQEIKRVLKPGGIFYCLTPLEGEKWILSPPERLAKKFHGHVQRFSRRELEDLFERTGLTIKRRYYSGYWLCQLVGVVYCWLWEWGKTAPDFSIAGYLKEEKRVFRKTIISLGRELVYFMINLESLVVPRQIPGYFIHLVTSKEKEQ
jgi:SAM-dependent methyltransferase